MGNSHSDNASSNDCVSVLADVAFRTSNYSPLEGSVQYKVLLRRGPISSIDHDEQRFVASAQPSAQATTIPVAEQRRKFVDPGSEIDRLLAEGFNLVSIVLLGDNNFLIFLLRCEHTTSIVGLKESRLSVINAELKLDRLRGETLVVGSQKLVLAGSEPPDNSSDELLEAIAHETANGGRLISAWPNGQVVNGLVKRLDVLFQIPTHCDDQHYAYQLTFTSLSDRVEGSNEEEELNCHVGRLSDDMHKALEAGWGLVDTVMASNDVLIWFLEREVSDALINEPSYEGRVIVFSFNETEPDRISASLNTLGQVGWVLRSIVTLSGGSKPRFIAFLQRQVERTDISVSSAATAADPARNRPAYGSRDMFAPPVYRPYDDYQFARGNAYIPDDEECDLPHYEDIIDRR